MSIIARFQKKRIPDVLTGYIYHFFHHLNNESDGQIARYIEETLKSCGSIGGCEYVCSMFLWRVYIGDRIIGLIKKISDPDTFFSSFLACELRTDMNNKEFLADLLKNQTAVANREIIIALTDFFHNH